MSQAYTQTGQWAAFSSAFEQFSGVVNRLRSHETGELEHGDIERLIETEGRELLRHLFQGHWGHFRPASPAACLRRWPPLAGGDGYDTSTRCSTAGAARSKAERGLAWPEHAA